MELWESAASIPELLKGFCVRQKQPPTARTRAVARSPTQGVASARARSPVEDFQPEQESERIGKGKGEVREGKVRAVDREVREEGKGEERDGRAALPLIKSMIFGRADCGQVDLNLWCFFFRVCYK